MKVVKTEDRQKENRWTKVFETPDEFFAEIIRGALEEHELDVLVLNKKDSIYNHIGYVEVYVLAHQSLRAIHLIKKYNSE